MSEKFGISYVLHMMDGISGPLGEIGKSFDEANKRFEKAGAGMRAVGQNMTKYITAPIAGWGAYAMAEARNINDAFIEVQDRFKGTGAELQKIKHGLVNESMTSPHSAEELLQLGAAGLQIGVAKEKLGEFSKMIADFGMVSKMSGEDATQALKEFASVTGTGYDDFRKILNVTTELGDRMNTTGARVLETSRQIGGIGKEVGMSIPQIQALSAWMNSMGQDAGMQMAQVLLKMKQAAKFGGGTDLGMFAAIMYGDANKTKNFQTDFDKNAVDTLGKFIDAVKKRKDEGLNASKEMEQLGLGSMRQVIQMSRMSRSIEDLAKAEEMANEQWRDGNAAADDAARRYQTLGAQLHMLRHTQAALGDDMGQIFLPIFIKLVSNVRQFTTGFREAPEWLRIMTVGVLGLAAGIGPLVIALGWLKGALLAIGISNPLFATITITLTALSIAISSLVSNWEVLSNKTDFWKHLGGFVLESVRNVGRSTKGDQREEEYQRRKKTNEGKSFWEIITGEDVASSPSGTSARNDSHHKVTIELSQGLRTAGVVSSGTATLNIMSPYNGSNGF